MTDEPARDRCTQLKQAIAQHDRHEREMEATWEETLARIDAQAGEHSPAQVAAVKKDLMASAASSRAHQQAIRCDMVRRLAIMEARARASGDEPTDPRSERRTELQDALEDLQLAEQRLEENVERQRAQILSMSRELMNPGVDPSAAVADMLAQLETVMPEVRAHFDAARAEFERELAALD